MSVKTKCKLKIKGNTLEFQILEMDERFRSELATGFNSFKSENEWRIISLINPVLNPGKKEIHLRGIDRRKDYNEVLWILNSEQEAKQAKAEIIEALKDWAKNWEGWK